jgi:hypothetical protein
MALCWLLIVLFIATILWSSQEHMTNKDLIDALKTFGVDNSGQVKPKSPSKNQEIYGPGLKESEKPPPKPLSDEDEAKKRAMRNAYPHIYGPEYRGAPGQSFEPPGFEKTDKPYSASLERACEHPGLEKTEKPYSAASALEPAGEPYYFNPDLQTSFPVTGPPQPFLTDFSKFQK